MGKGTAVANPGKNKAGSGNLETKTYPVSGPLRFLLHQVEIKLGLFSSDSGIYGYERFRAPALLKRNAPVPPEMASVFGPELAALDRIGKPTNRCHFSDFPPLKLFCLPYYHFDGFNAVVYAERNGKFFAAWKEQEMHAERSPETILAPGPFEEFQPVFREVLSHPA